MDKINTDYKLEKFRPHFSRRAEPWRGSFYQKGPKRQV